MHEEEILMGDELQPEAIPVEEGIPEQTPESSAEFAPEDQPEEATELAPVDEALPVEEVTDDQQETTELVPVEEDQPTGEEAQSPEETAEEAQTVEETVVPAPNPEEVPYHERYYLKYREGKRSTALDLDGTISFLQELGFDGGELRNAREGKDCAESFRNADKNKNNQMYCSYCGTEIAGVEFYRLPDGRLRCTNCSKTVIKTKVEVEELCQRVKDNLDNFFGATIDVPVSIEVVDERKLKKKVGLGTRDTQSMLILGVAINKKKKYSIILENGAPRISLIATFAHELTHIWQYTHWDANKNLPKCHKSKRLLIYEGMAKWAEIQYLYLIGETAVAKREEYITRNRQDEYGIGFCIYEDQYPLSREAMFCENTPFTPDRYPLD